MLIATYGELSRGRHRPDGAGVHPRTATILLGWTEDRARRFYIRQLRDIKIKPLIEGTDAIAMGRYAEWCGWALARAHAKSGAAAMISGYLGSRADFDKAVAKFALTYAEQNERDHKALLTAIRDGRIKTFEE